MARPVSSSHEVRRDEILEVAAACFARQSYPAASMSGIAAACGASKALLYHYYQSKEAMLFDLLERYTRKLLDLLRHTQAQAQAAQWDERTTLHALLRALLAEYETSATRHAALLGSVQFLGQEQRDTILNRQRELVAAVTRLMRRAYPRRVSARNQTAITMSLFGMINWTFTWLRPDGPMRYTDYAEQVIAMLDHGLLGPAAARPRTRADNAPGRNIGPQQTTAS